MLLKHYLNTFESDIREHVANEKGWISQAILLWNCIHHTLNIYQDKHPEWMFVKHEHLSFDPVPEFEKIYKFFGLEFTARVESAILDSSGKHNPIEQQSGSEFVRNSKANITNWKSRLSRSEIQRIKEGTRNISSLFYTDNDW